MKSALSQLLLLAICLAFPALPAWAESRIEKSLKLEPGGQLTVDVEIGRVTVTGRSNPGVRVVITSSRDDLDDLLSFRFEEQPSSVTIAARKKHLRSWFFSFGKAVHFDIQIPAATELRVDTSGGRIEVSGLRSRAKLKTSGGAIQVRDLLGDLVADTSGGGIHLTDIRGKIHAETSGGGIDGTALDGPVDAETSGGSITLDRVTGDIRAHSSGGGIRIVGAGGRVKADTSGGSIEASFGRGNARGGSLETSGGGIAVSLDPNVSLEIDASGNSVRADVPITIGGEISHRRLRGTLGKGGETLRLRTSGGSVRIQAL